MMFLKFFTNNRDLQSTANSDAVTRVEPVTRLTGINDDHESSTTSAAVSERSGRQYYQPQAMYAYQQYPHRRAYKNPQSKKRPMRTKSGRRPGRPASRPRKPSSPVSMQMSRYRRLPSPVRQQQVNYIDSAGVDYGDGFESGTNAVSFDYDDPATVGTAYMYGHGGHVAQAQAQVAQPVAVVASSGRSRKRPVSAAVTMAGYADESHQTVVHVPVRVTRPAAIPTVAVTVADPMDKLRQMVHEAMDEHFANRHQELYTDGFDKQHQVYSAKYKRQQTAADKDKLQQRTADAVKSSAVMVPLAPSQSAETAKTSADTDADGSDDRLTLAQISAYMGAKPAETVLSTGGHRYVLSDALQQSYRQQQQNQQQQFQQQQVQRHYGGGGDDRHNNQQSYLRYVSPFEAVYDLPVAQWTYK